MPDNHGNRLDPYHVLGVSRSASQRQIRRAYLALAKQHHPDRGGDAARFDQVTKAWKQLSEVDSPPPTRRQPRPQPQRKRAAKSTREAVQFIPPLTETPTRASRNLPIIVDPLLAQQVVHGTLPGGLRRRKERALHAHLSEVLRGRLHGALPAVRIFHGVKLSRRLVLDTVVLGGTRVAVLGVQYAPPDVYQFSGTHLIGHKRIELPDLTKAVLGLQKLLPDFQVGGFDVVFSANPHAPTIQANDALNTLGLTEAPASVMDAVRNIKFFIGTGNPNVVDRAAMGQLIAKL